jgi:hypothetical protein
MFARIFVSIVVALLAGFPAGSVAQSPFTVDDLVRLKRLSDPEISPDGRYVAYALSETDMEANKGRSSVWLLDLARKDAPLRRLTQSEAHDSSPRWAADTAAHFIFCPRARARRRCGASASMAARPTFCPLFLADVGHSLSEGALVCLRKR